MNTGHDTDILRRLFLQDQHGIVNRHDPHHTHLMIHDRQRDQAVLGNRPRRVLLIVRRLCIEHIRIHDLFDQLRFAGRQELLYIHHSDQLLLLGHIAGIDRLPVKPHLADPKYRICNRHLLAERDIIHIHHASGAVLRVLEQLIDLSPLLLVRSHQQPVHHISRHLLQYVHRIVQVHLLHDLFKL